MRQPAEAQQHVQHRLPRQAAALAQGERRQGVGEVVGPGQDEIVHRQHRRGAAADPVGAGVFADAPVGVLRRSAEREAGLLRDVIGQRQRGGVVPVDDGGLGVGEDALLGGTVGGHVRMAVQVVRAEVEHRRGHQRQGVRGLELEAGQLDDVELDVIGQQVRAGSPRLPPTAVRLPAVRAI
jgi:hypothetical protein